MCLGDQSKIASLCAAVNQSLQSHNITDSDLHEIRFIALNLCRRLPACVDVEDLVQAGCVEFLSATKQQAMMDSKAYRRLRIAGAMYDSLRAQDHLSRYARDRERQLRRTTMNLSHRLGRTPEANEIAAELSISLPSFHETNARSRLSSLDSLDTGAEHHTDRNHTDRKREPRCESASPELHFLQLEIAAIVRKAVRDLNSADSIVLRGRYFEEKPMGEIARHLGVTPARVSQIHARALNRMREALAGRNLEKHEWRTSLFSRAAVLTSSA